MSETATNKSNTTQSIWKQAGFLQRINKLALPQSSSSSNFHNSLSSSISTATSGIQFDVIQQTLKLFRHIKRKQQEQEKQLNQRSHSECSSEKSSDSDTDINEDSDEIFSIWDERESRLNGYFNLEQLSCSELYKLRSITGEDWVSDQTAITNYSIIRTLALNQMQEKLMLQEKLKQSQSQLYLLNLQTNNKSNKSPAQPKRLGLLPFPASNEIVHPQTTEQLLKETSKITINPELALTDSFKAFNAYFSAAIKQDQLKNRHPNYSRYSKYFNNESQTQLSLEATAAETVKKKFLIEQAKAENITNRKRKSKSLYQGSQNFPTSSTFKTTLNSGINSDEPFGQLLGKQRQQEKRPENKKNLNINTRDYLKKEETISDSSPLRVQLRKVSSVKSPQMYYLQSPIISSIQTEQQYQSNFQNVSPSSPNLLPMSPLKKRAISLKSLRNLPQLDRSSLRPIDYCSRAQSITRMPFNNPQSLAGIAQQEEEAEGDQLENDVGQFNEPSQINDSQSQSLLNVVQPFVLRSHVDFNFKNNERTTEQPGLSTANFQQKRDRSTPHLRDLPSLASSLVFSPDSLHRKTRISTDRIESVITLIQNSKQSPRLFSPTKTFSPGRKPLPFPKSQAFSTATIQHHKLNSFLPKIEFAPEMNSLKNAQAHLQEPHQMQKLDLFKATVQHSDYLRQGAQQERIIN